MAIMVILSMALNSYWFILMVKMIVRVIKRALAPKQEDNIEKTGETNPFYPDDPCCTIL